MKTILSIPCVACLAFLWALNSVHGDEPPACEGPECIPCTQAIPDPNEENPEDTSVGGTWPECGEVFHPGDFVSPPGDPLVGPRVYPAIPDQTIDEHDLAFLADNLDEHANEEGCVEDFPGLQCWQIVMMDVDSNGKICYEDLGIIDNLSGSYGHEGAVLSTPLWGDANLDQHIVPLPYQAKKQIRQGEFLVYGEDDSDLLVILNHMNGTRPLVGQAFDNANVFLDDVVDIWDASMIAECFGVELPDEFDRYLSQEDRAPDERYDGESSGLER